MHLSSLPHSHQQTASQRGARQWSSVHPGFSRGDSLPTHGHWLSGFACMTEPPCPLAICPSR